MTDMTEKGDDEAYLYADAGIQERHGAIPMWLKLVVTGLLLWGVYYLIQYWSTW